MRWVLISAGVLGALAIGYLAWVFPRAGAAPEGEAAFATSADGAQVAYYASGAGPRVVLLASLGRSVGDFNELAASLRAAGFRTVAVESRGVGETPLPEAGRYTLYDLGKDIEAALLADGLAEGETVAVIGHAFGNRVARAFAHKYPDRVDKLALVASGGSQNLQEMPEVLSALRGSFVWWKPPPLRKNDVRYAFFAGDNPIPDDWFHGWHQEASRAQSAAVRATPVAEWRDAGGWAPILILQGDADRVAPAEITSAALKRDYADRVTINVVENAGHALLPEAPDRIATAVVEFLHQPAQPASETASADTVAAGGER